MPKAARTAALISRSTTSSNNADNTFFSVAIFSGIGLLMSLVAIIMGVPGVGF